MAQNLGIQGKVKFFNSIKGYGFLTSNEDHKEYFFHTTNVLGEKPKGEDLVSFQLIQDKRGIKAIDVKKI